MAAHSSEESRQRSRRAQGAELLRVRRGARSRPQRWARCLGNQQMQSGPCPHYRPPGPTGM